MEAVKEEVVRTPPRPAVIRNSVKVKALLYLDLKNKLRPDAPPIHRGATAREIARATGAKAKSLYVLLERWDDWLLVNRDLETMPFAYTIAEEGERYLSKLGNWFFSGYYSKKRKRRMPGYRGNALKIQLELAAAVNLVFITYNTKLKELLYFKPPYHKATDFVREPIIDGKRKKWGPEYLLVLAGETISDIYNVMISIFGHEWCKPAGQAMVDAELAVWKQL